MRKLIYYVATSLDGCIAHHNGTWDGFIGEGAHADEYVAWMHSCSAVVMGRATYEIAPRMGVVDPYPYLETYVFSRTLAPVDHPNIHVIRDEASAYLAALKQRPAANGSTAPIYFAGGGAFAASILASGLIDEIIVKLNPFLMGDGIRVAETLPAIVPLELIAAKTHANGVLLLTYRPTPPPAAPSSPSGKTPDVTPTSAP
jgi:dihydrofolate reductase